MRRTGRQRATGVRQRTALAVLASGLFAGCTSTPPPAPIAPEHTLAQFSARRLDAVGGLPPASQGWDRSQWLQAALALNPQLAEERAAVDATAAAERTAAEIPNPSMELFAEYLRTAAASPAWLYGVSLDFLLRRPGERARARQQAALQTALAQSELTESIWQVRSGLRQALLESVAAEAQTSALNILLGDRTALASSDQARVRVGDLPRTQLLSDELELVRIRQRAQQSEAHGAQARARLAIAVGVPLAALKDVPLSWANWEAIDGLSTTSAPQWRDEALIGRPQLVAALREYDLAELNLRGEVAKRWPELRVTPAYAWGGKGVQEDALDQIASESALGVSFELPVFNQHQGAIGEALGRRTAAGEHLKTVQAQIFGEIDRASLTWMAARGAWADATRLADLALEQQQDEERAVRAGASDRSAVLVARIAATEAVLARLEAAYAAQTAYGALEDAYRRPLEGAESQWPPPAYLPRT